MKHGWTIRDLDLVDWESLRLVSKSDTAADNLWKMKMASRFVPVGKRVLLYGKWDNSLCPCCSKCEETVEHLLCCQELGSQLLRRQKIREFRQWMISVKTDPDLIETVINILLSSTSGSFSHHLPPTASDSLRSAAFCQDRLGGISCFQGYIARGWKVAQQEYWDSLHLQHKRSIRQWGCRFLRQWFSFSKSLWEHRNSILHHKE